jgi:NitT/TauT family transport system permease protein
MTQVTDLPPVLEREFLASGAGRWTTAARRSLPALLLFVAALAVWEAVVVAFRIEGFLLPRPSVIAATFVREFAVIFPAGLFTLRGALGGFAIGGALGLLVALATARWATVNEGLMPFAIAVNAMPIIALAPIMNQWFGITNPLSRMSIVAVIVFFPVMINAVRGLTQVGAGPLELMRSYAAGDFAILYQLRIPHALPFVFSAFKVGSTLSVIGAIVSEYFGGSREALGVYISQQAALFRFAEAWSAIIIACFIGIVFYGLILLVERLVMPWHVSFRNSDGG